jgi:hypothetical protein
MERWRTAARVAPRELFSAGQDAEALEMAARLAPVVFAVKLCYNYI